MIFGRSQRGKPPVEPVTLKILVAGGFGVGKTTLVGAVSEIRPLRTEELLTEAGRPVDDVSGVEGKHTTTVAMDFGRITLREDLVLYLFGTPGQERFWFMWDELSEGALGAWCWPTPGAGGLLRRHRLLRAALHPVRGRRQLLRGVGALPGRDRPPGPRPRRGRAPGDVRARDRESVKEVLIGVVQHAMTQAADRRRAVPT